jgi:dTDP-glucose 4,6-dehydratase
MSISDSEFKDSTILVTGGAGFIGSQIVDRLMAEGAHVRVIDDMSNGSKENLAQWKDDERFRLIMGDIRDSEEVNESLKDVDFVFHEAAKVSVPASVKNPTLTMDVNASGTCVVLDECRKADVEKVVVASSSSVYGDTPTLPKTEDMPLKPLSPYAASKLAEEKLAIAFCETYDLDVTALRYFNVYGPRQRSGAYAGVIAIFIRQALAGKPVTIDGDGQQSRDFTFVNDVVDCNLLSVTKSQAKGEVYNVGGGSRITIEELADKIIEITGSSSKKEFGPPRPGDVRHSLAGIDKAQSQLGYDPETDMDTGLRKTIDWVKRESQ